MLQHAEVTAKHSDVRDLLRNAMALNPVNRNSFQMNLDWQRKCYLLPRILD